MNTVRSKSNYEKFWGSLTLILLAAYFFCGLGIFRDYGASSDEFNQIEAGHITWTAVCEKLGMTPPDFGELPKLEEYYNRYYGQAATFPTVIIEALRNFSMDVSSVLRLRHFWNFLLWFIGLICFGILLKLRYQRYDVICLTILLHILTPRLFGDVFYNDRDVLLISLLWISLLCFALFCRRPGFFTALLCAFFFALAINTRYFALVLVLLPLMYLLRHDSQKKITALLLLGLTILFFYLFTPLLWGNFAAQFAAGFRMFSSGRQRTQETLGMAEILFFGKSIPENALPFYYVPLWIFISTPLIPQLLCGFGLLAGLRKKKELMDRFMLLFLCGGMAAVMTIRPVLYNGWRHMYFFHVPIFWFAASGLNALLTKPQKALRYTVILLTAVSAISSAIRIAALHPYEYIYLNALFRSRENSFDRDYWRLSTTECLEWIWEQEQDEFRVSDTNTNIDNAIIGLFPWQRSRIMINQYNALHRFPADYLIYTYSGTTGNEQTYPLFESRHVIERDGVKLAEVFKRCGKITPVIRSIQPDLPEITDGIIDLETEWRSESTQNPEDRILIEFDKETTLRGLSLLPGDDENEYARSPEVSISADGVTWETLPAVVSDLFDLSIPETTARFIRIRNTDESDVRWSVREIYFFN